MAGKQIGKWRQWAGEVIAARDKTIMSDEFRAHEQDIELRRQGLSRLDIASGDYQHHLSKKKHSLAVETEDKLIALDALGIVMIKHGEEFGDDSAYGTSLVNLGRAHCKVATLQESYAITLEETYCNAIRQSEDEIKEYQSQRKKLESRRLTYDAASNKLEKYKNAKKEKELKERADAEEEFDNAKARYEETLEDVRVRMTAIQENEVVQLRELTGFLDLEITYVEQYLEVLRDVKSGWVDEATMKRLEAPRQRPPPPRPASRAASVRSTKSASSKPNGPDSRRPSDDSSDEEEDQVRPRKKSLTRRKSESGNKPPSRPHSRATSRKRSDSTATAKSEKDGDKPEKMEKTGSRLSVAGWASSAVNSFRGKKDKDKDKFATLRDDSDSDDEVAPHEFGEKKQHHRRISAPTLPTISPKVPLRPLKPSRSDSGGKKRVVALHDFAAASSDELSFKAGDQIDVINEVLDGWWMGELRGKRGIFPTTYTEVLNSSSSSLHSKPPLPQRPSASLARSLGLGSSTSSSSLEDGRPIRHHSYDDTEHPFGDHNVARGRSYEESITSFETGSDNEEDRLVPMQTPDSFKQVAGTPPMIPRRTTDTTPKKAPPPPPPRRSTLSSTPPIPPARPHSKSSQSSSAASFQSLVNTGIGADELTFSPFDSPKEERMRVGCSEFKQNPFKPAGVCSNCFQTHTLS